MVLPTAVKDSPPTASVEDVPQYKESPALWNPGAAAGWSLLFTPIFGATVQMKNWQALGEPAKAAQSKLWVLGSIVFIALLMVLGNFLPETKAVDYGIRGAGLGLLITWYNLSSRDQESYVAARFGTTYSRRRWGRPLLYTVLGILGVFTIALAVFVVIPDNEQSTQNTNSDRDLMTKADVSQMDSVALQVAKDTEVQFGIASHHGDKMQICVQAVMVSAAYLQGKDEASYGKWKTIEKHDCKQAGMPSM